jgi:hypothetical protein
MTQFEPSQQPAVVAGSHFPASDNSGSRRSSICRRAAGRCIGSQNCESAGVGSPETCLEVDL